MADFDTSEFRATRFARSRADEIGERSFPVVMRGYDRAAVDAFVQEVRELVADLESRQSQETVVQRALEYLEAPILRVTGFDTPFPYSLEHEYLPTADRVLHAVRQTLEW